MPRCPRSSTTIKSTSPYTFKKGDKVLLCLHKGYSIPQPANAIKVDKLGQRYVGPFEVVGRVGKQAYRLDIPGHWKVYPVFSVAQLEPYPDSIDPFNRPIPDKPDSVFVEGDTDEYKSYTVQRLLNKRVRCHGKGHSIKYLVRWQGYGPEYNQWYNVKYLDNAQQLVEDYEKAIQEDEDLAPLLLREDSASPLLLELPPSESIDPPSPANNAPPTNAALTAPPPPSKVSETTVSPPTQPERVIAVVVSKRKELTM